ncbi:MAG: helix-turn-helix domain-containing protein [Pseudonocardiaceae bacterium]
MAPAVGEDALLTTGEAAVVLGSSRQHVVDLCERGHLSCIKIGTHRRVRRAEVEALANPQLTRDQERSLWLHRVVAGRLVMDPDGILAKARANINTLSRAHQGSATGWWIEQWQMVLDGPLDSLLDVLTSPSARAIELRQNSPFAGVLSEQERQAALAAFRAHWRRDHVA